MYHKSNTEILISLKLLVKFFFFYVYCVVVTESKSCDTADYNGCFLTTAHSCHFTGHDLKPLYTTISVSAARHHGKYCRVLEKGPSSRSWHGLWGDLWTGNECVRQRDAQIVEELSKCIGHKLDFIIDAGVSQTWTLYIIENIIILISG